MQTCGCKSWNGRSFGFSDFCQFFHIFQPRTHIFQINAKIFMQIVGIVIPIRQNNNILLNYIRVVYYILSICLKIVKCEKVFMDKFMTKSDLYSWIAISRQLKLRYIWLVSQCCYMSRDNQLRPLWWDLQPKWPKAGQNVIFPNNIWCLT